MNTREISIAVNKDLRSVQRWAKKASVKMSSIETKLATSTSVCPANYDLNETIAIIEAGLGKNAAELYRANAERNVVTISNDTDLRAAFSMMADAFNRLAKISDDQNMRLSRLESQIETRRALLPPPQIKPRDHITKLVREYASRSGLAHRDVWSSLYRDFGYRTNSNPGQCARNRGMAIIDYIEAEGQLETLESVALEIYGESR